MDKLTMKQGPVSIMVEIIRDKEKIRANFDNSWLGINFIQEEAKISEIKENGSQIYNKELIII